MAQPEFLAPDFVDEADADVIQERMMEQLPADISDMEGDFPYDFTMPTAIEISQLIQFYVVRALMIAFPEYAWDEWLDLHGAQAGVTRNAATYATGYVSVTAQAGVTIPIGTVFAVPATDLSPAVEFTTMENASYSVAGTKLIPIQAVEAGIEGNVAANTITIMGISLTGISSITNPNPTSGGTEEEDDDAYYDRIHAEFNDAQFYVGNDADYIKWAKEVDGIGDCIVSTDESEPGVVRLTLIDSNGSPASASMVQAVYNHIVSPDDRSKRLLPTACAQLIVSAATTKTINYVCSGLILNGVTIADVTSAFEAAVLAIYSSAKEDNILRYNQVRSALTSIEGIIDFDTFTMNGAMTNITLLPAEYAATGTCTFTEEE